MTTASLMVRMAAGVPNDALLLLTADLAARLKVTKVIGISACQPVQIYGSYDMYVPPQFITWDREQIDKELGAAEDSFRAALEGKVTSLEWRSTVVTYGSIADYVAEQMRAADLLIAAAEEGGSIFDRTKACQRCRSGVAGRATSANGWLNRRQARPAKRCRGLERHTRSTPGSRRRLADPDAG